ncbi:MAG TPA: VOC family protein [Candidatus Solibacter sp.]|nr:VOC family protein [Candidatus Solibacter sp.]
MRFVFPILALAAVLALPQTNSAPELAGIAHVAFRVSDFQKSRDFYRTLGFEQAFEFGDPGKPPVSYIKINDRQFIELYGRTDASQPTGLLHLCYEVTDIESLWNDYVKRGLNPPPSRKAHAGNLLFVLHAPDGQTLEYTQYLPGSLHFEDRGMHLGDHAISKHLVRAIIRANDLSAEHDFYTSKLGFQDVATGGVIRMCLPGNSGDEIELKSAASSMKPRLVFNVTNLARAAQELRNRSLTVARGAGSVSVTDPDGTVIMFTSEKLRSRGNPDGMYRR